MELLECPAKGIYAFPAFGPDALAVFTTREFDAAKDILRFLEALGVPPKEGRTIKQVHGNKILLTFGTSRPLGEEEADGLVTQERGLVLMIRTADCVPLFLFDPGSQAVGICHVGWRGAKLNIVSKMIETLKQEFGTGPLNLVTAIGPAIEASCYEVGEEFENYFPRFVKRQGGKWTFDLVGLVKQELCDAGVPEEAIGDAKICTACSTEQFFSARREGNDTGRFISGIMLK